LYASSTDWDSDLAWLKAKYEVYHVTPTTSVLVGVDAVTGAVNNTTDHAESGSPSCPVARLNY
jgi:hypothetical protein